MLFNIIEHPTCHPTCHIPRVVSSRILTDGYVNTGALRGDTAVFSKTMEYSSCDPPVCTQFTLKSSTLSVLYQQVKEQSSFCDVTLKIGKWTKRFHWHMLSQSPFFRAAHRDCFREAQTGIIELHGWSPVSVDIVMSSLYGVRPDITMDNISELLDMAEFFLLSQLKGACVNVLNNTPVTPDNCDFILQLLSLYEIEAPIVDAHIMDNLTDFTRQGNLCNISLSSFLDLVSNDAMCHIETEDWFQLLINWTNHSADRDVHFPQLFDKLDILDCHPDFVRSVIMKTPVVMHSMECMSKLEHKLDKYESRTKLLLISGGSYMSFRSNIWHTLQLDQNDDFENAKLICAIGEDSSILCYRQHSSSKLFFRDLVTNETKIVQEVLKDRNETENETVKRRLDDTGTHALHVVRRSLPNQGFMKTSTLYKGRIQEPVTDLHPIMSIKHHFIIEMCCNKAGVTAMLSMDRSSVLLYDTMSCQIARICFPKSFNIDYEDKLVSTSDGFAIYNSKRIVCISLSGIKLTTENCHMRQIVLPSFGEKTRYFFCNNNWVRIEILRSNRVAIYIANHQQIISREDTRDLTWTRIPMPNHALERDRITVIAACVPRKLHRCCHCDHTHHGRYCLPLPAPNSNMMTYKPRPTTPYHGVNDIVPACPMEYMSIDRPLQTMHVVPDRDDCIYEVVPDCDDDIYEIWSGSDDGFFE